MTTSHIKYAILVAIAGVLFLCAFQKARLAGFTHDESVTFTKIVAGSTTDIISYKYATANNHMLNSLLMKMSHAVFGNDEWALRLPNLLSFLCYLAVVCLYSAGLKAVLAAPTLLFLAVNPYLLDFFALARGYGLSIGCMMLSLYFMVLFTKKQRLRLHATSLLFGTLSVLSSFGMLFFLTSLILSSYLSLFFSASSGATSSKKRWIQISVINALFAVVVILLIYHPIERLLSANQLYFGGDQGFMSNTVNSLIRALKYDARWDHAGVVLRPIFIIVVILSGVVSLVLLFRRSVQKHEAQWLVIASFVLLGTILGSIVSFQLFHSKLVIERAALYIFPLFLLNASGLLNLLIPNKDLTFIPLVLLWGIGFIWTTHFIDQYQTQFYRDWAYDQDTKKAIDNLIVITGQSPEKETTSLCVDWILEPSTKYYTIKNDLKWLEVIKRHKVSDEISANFYYLRKNRLGQVQHVKQVATFRDSQNVLWKETKD